ncbi:MAG: TolC family outer membrane protein [Pseudomonadota bacterium]
MARRVSLGLTALTLAAAIGTPAAAETLNQALAAAYKHNPQLDAQRARLRATDEGVAQAKSGFRPLVRGSADVNVVNTETRPPSPSDGTIYPRGYEVNFSQPLFTGFRTPNAIRESEANVRAGRATLRNVEQQVLLSAVTAYMDVVRDQAIVRLQENNVRVLSRELRATRDRFSVGEVTRTDVAQAQARQAAAVSALDLARANLRSSRAVYEQVIGSKPGRLHEPRPHRRLLPPGLHRAIHIALKENPLVRTAQFQEQAGRFTVARIRAELNPTIELQGQFQKRFDPSRFVDRQQTARLTGRIDIPLYQRGEVSARVRQAKHNHVALIQEIQRIRNEVKANVISAWSQLRASRAQLRTDRSQVQANQIALTGVREEERVGQRTLLDVLNAQLELLNSRVSLVTTQRNLVVASYNLLSAIGRLSVQELHVSKKVYDPQVHYFEIRKKWWGLSITHKDGKHEYLDLWGTHGRRHHADHRPYRHKRRSHK